MQPKLIIVNLGALELVRVIDVNSFPLGEEIDGGDGGLAMSVAGLLGAAEGQVGFGANRGRIHVDDPRVEIAGCLKCAVHLACVDRSRKTVDDAVGNIDGLLEIVHRNHGNDRSEDFLLSDAHLWRAIAKHGGSVEPTFGKRSAIETISTG